MGAVFALAGEAGCDVAALFVAESLLLVCWFGLAVFVGVTCSAAATDTTCHADAGGFVVHLVVDIAEGDGLACEVGITGIGARDCAAF